MSVFRTRALLPLPVATDTSPLSSPAPKASASARTGLDIEGTNRGRTDLCHAAAAAAITAATTAAAAGFCVQLSCCKRYKPTTLGLQPLPRPTLVQGLELARLRFVATMPIVVRALTRHTTLTATYLARALTPNAQTPACLAHRGILSASLSRRRRGQAKLCSSSCRLTSRLILINSVSDQVLCLAQSSQLCVESTLCWIKFVSSQVCAGWRTKSSLC